MKEAAAAINVPQPSKVHIKVKPVQPSKRTKRERTEEQPRRVSTRLRGKVEEVDDPNESPAAKKRRLVRISKSITLVLIRY